MKFDLKKIIHPLRSMIHGRTVTQTRLTERVWRGVVTLAIIAILAGGVVTVWIFLRVDSGIGTVLSDNVGEKRVLLNESGLTRVAERLKSESNAYVAARTRPVIADPSK